MLMLEDTNFVILCLGLIGKKIVIMIQINKIPLFFSPFDNHCNLGCERCPGSSVVIKKKKSMIIIEFMEETKFWSY